MVNSRPLLGINTTADAGQPQSTRLNKQGAGYQKVRTLLVWCVIAAFWGSMINWRFRNAMNPDGISYLDIARQALSSGPSALINPHWSPLYPALIAFSEWVHKPSPFSEFAQIHAVNAVIYTLAAVSFAYFLRQLLVLRSTAGRYLAHEAIFIAFAFALFFRFINADLTPFVMSPDLLVSSTIFLASGLFFRILREEAKSKTFLLLGLVLGLGYLAKSIMLPAGILLLCILFLACWRSKSRRQGVLLAFLVMGLVSAPQIAAVSKRVGHFSIAETGRLNYLWWVDGLPFEGWTGTPGIGNPIHGPRIIGQDPKIIEFASPIPGTYPLWFDPTYWFAGARIKLDLKRQIRAIRNSLSFYHVIFPDLELPLLGLAFLLILAYHSNSRLGRAELLFLFWPCTLLGLYALLFTEYRYIAPLLVVLWVAAYSAALSSIDKVHSSLLALLAVLMLLSSAKQTFAETRRIVAPGSTDPPQVLVLPLTPPPSPSPDQIAARKLMRIGLKPGDAIATVGDAFAAYYAHIAQLRVIAEVVDPVKFWSLRDDSARQAEQALAHTGAKVLVAKEKPEGFQPEAWQKITGTPYSVLRLRE